MSDKVATATYNVMCLAEELKFIFLPYANKQEPLDEKKALELMQDIANECEGVLK